MANDLLYRFVVDKPAKTMTIRREFAAPKSLVWDCYTQSDLLDQWFAPEGLTTKTAHMDFAPGGYWLYAMVMPDGGEFWGRFDYIEMSPKDSYAAWDGFTDAKGTINPDLPRARWDVTFEDRGVHCVVNTVVSYDTEAQMDQVIAMNMEEGTKSTMGKLDRLLAKLA